MTLYMTIEPICLLPEAKCNIVIVIMVVFLSCILPDTRSDFFTCSVWAHLHDCWS